MSEVEAPTSGAHELKQGPTELAPGWVVECTCGWSNERVPAPTADAARSQFQVHAR